MKLDVIAECTALSLSEKISFPEVVRTLFQAGVERYVVDLVGYKKTTYGQKGEVVVGEFLFERGEIPHDLDPTEVKNALQDIQKGHIQYQAFLKRLVRAGCCHYEVFMTGGRALYFGRQGTHHEEIFPKVVP